MSASDTVDGSSTGAEFGIVAAVGRKGVEQLLAVVTDSSNKRVPEVAQEALDAKSAAKMPVLDTLKTYPKEIALAAGSEDEEVVPLDRRSDQAGEGHPARRVEGRLIAGPVRGVEVISVCSRIWHGELS